MVFSGRHLFGWMIEGTTIFGTHLLTDQIVAFKIRLIGDHIRMPPVICFEAILQSHSGAFLKERV